MDLQLANKSVLVTGSTAGIGFAIAALFAEEGAKVVVNGRSEARVKEAAEKIRRKNKNAQVVEVAADLATKEGVAALTKKVSSVDVLVNNLGIYEARPFLEITDEEWSRIFEVNVLSGVRLSRFYLPKMLKQNWGRIVFLSSESALEHARRDDPLRRDQDGPDRIGPRPGGNDRRHGRHGQLGPCGTDAFGGGRKIRGRHGQIEGDERGRRGTGVLQIGAAFVAAQTVRNGRRSGRDGRLRLESARLGNQRVRAPRRGRRRALHRVKRPHPALSLRERV